MAIYLVQHGKNLPEEIDPEKGLSDEGIEDVRRIAAVARNYGIRIHRIHHSGKKRARQTAEIIASEMTPAPRVQAVEGMNPLDDVTRFAQEFPPRSALALVGHLPFLQRLASYLMTGDAGFPVFQFQNAGIVCMDRDDGTPLWHIKWSLMPDIE